MRSSIFKGDKALWVIYGFLTIISIVEVFSATSTLAYRAKESFMRPMIGHLFVIGLSFCFIWLISVQKRSFFRNALLWSYPIAFGLLLFVMATGSSVNNATRWIRIAGFTIQPSEVFKFALVILSATLLSGRIRMSKQRVFIVYWIAAFIPIGLIALENLSTGLFLGLFVMIFSWIALAPKKPYARLWLAFLTVGALGLTLLLVLSDNQLDALHHRAPTWKSRVESIVGIDDMDKSKLTAAQIDSLKYVINDDNFQSQHAKIAIANSRFWGVLPGNSLERDILPQAYSDYIYAIIIEELGVTGMIVVPLLYFWLLFRIAQLSTRTDNKYYKYLLWGFGLIYPLQAMINFTVVADFLVTGQTLPLISRGGTSFLMTSLAFGVMIGVSNIIEKEREAKLTHADETGTPEVKEEKDYDQESNH